MDTVEALEEDEDYLEYQRKLKIKVKQDILRYKKTGGLPKEKRAVPSSGRVISGLVLDWFGHKEPYASEDALALKEGLKEFLSSLSEKESEIFNQNVCLGKKQTETAKLFGVTKQSINRVVKKIRTKAREIITKKLQY